MERYEKRAAQRAAAAEKRDSEKQKSKFSSVLWVTLYDAFVNNEHDVQESFFFRQFFNLVAVLADHVGAA